MDAKRQIEILEDMMESNNHGELGLYIACAEFFRIYVGQASDFYIQLHQMRKRTSDFDVPVQTTEIIMSYIQYIKKGLSTGSSLEKKIKLETVSDFLEQAQVLLNTKDIHPAAPCVLIGASLEEFLRVFAESKEVSIGNSKPSIDSYSKALRTNNLIDSQDIKDITAWAGLRNKAAHGRWNEIEDRKIVELMLLGVNLFMRKYSNDSNQ